jgi:hypothetical protein
LSVHRFSALQRNLREDWFASPETRDDTWVNEGAIGEGESQSIRVRNTIDGMMGVAKPGPALGAQGDHCRAAHERLAFDLAYLAALPVAAVILWPQDMPSIYKRGTVGSGARRAFQAAWMILRC